MGCGCAQRRNLQYVWTDGTDTVVYPTEIQAKAKILRKGGSYTPAPVEK